MSIDNGVYILKFPDGYRVKECQAIDNIYWWPICCSNPDIEYGDEDNYWIDRCKNCGKIDPPREPRDRINPQEAMAYFKRSKVFEKEDLAWAEAQRLYHKAMNDYGIVEYGIQNLGSV